MRRTLFLALLLAVGLAAIPVVADGLREDELTPPTRSEGVSVQPLDLRTCWPMEIQRLIGVSYSAVGWNVTPLAAGASVRLNLVAGAFDGKTFYPDSILTSQDLATGLTGKGTFLWYPRVEKRVYRLLHETKRGESVVEDETICAYFDFSACDLVTETEFRNAVLGITGAIAIVHDDAYPWLPIVRNVAGSGVATDPELASGNASTLGFAFAGRGTLHYEYALDGGSLAVLVDGEVAEEFTEPVEWQQRTIRLENLGSHTVVFVFTAAGDGSTALVRGVRWEEDDVEAWMHDAAGGVRMDLREGVRKPKYFSEILPFAYSSTNWVGVTGATAASSVRVTLVPMTGAGSDTTQWTESGDPIELYRGPGEGSVKWPKPEKGLWKATFDILNGDTGIYSEDAFFDLWKTRNSGFMLMVF